jgi:DNA-binding transcriptional ArsR family regulator
MLNKKKADVTSDAAKLLTALGNRKRLAIVGHLLDDEMSVNEIAEQVSLSQSALSQHLAKLRGLNLVQTRRDRQMIYYSCNSEEVRKIYNTLNDIFGEM